MSAAATYKLGKKAAVKDPRTLKLSNYVSLSRLPAPPDRLMLSKKVPIWQMYDNDSIGDCAIAGPAHQHTCWTANAEAATVVPTREAVIADYSAVGGYQPGNPATDNGCVLIEVMRYWRNTGITGRKIDAFAAIDPQDHEMVCTAINLFGGVCIGLRLPIAAQDMEVWKAPTSRFHRRGIYAPGSWGGHCVEVLDYAPELLGCCTWGSIKSLSWNFLDVYCDEMFCASSQDWISDLSLKAPSGFDAAALLADINSITGSAA